MSPQEQLQDSSAEETLPGAQRLFRELMRFSRLQERRTAATGQAGNSLSSKPSFLGAA